MEIPGGLAAVRITLLDEAFSAILGPVFYRVQKITINEKGRKQDTTSTGGPTGDAIGEFGIIPPGSTTRQLVFGDGILSVKECDITLVEASYDRVTNLLARPIVFNVGSFLRITVFPDVVTAPAVFWDFLHCQIETVDHEVDATALQPVTLKAYTKGAYTNVVA